MTPGIGKRAGLALFRQYRKVQTRLHTLDYLFWECTLRCNLSCLHCGSDCTAQPGVPDMPLADFLAVLEEIQTVYEPGKVMLALTGGEPLLRSDLADCGRAFGSRGFPWGIVTNGLLLDKRALDRLLEAGLASLTVSLDGLEANHNWLRGHPQSFAAAIRAIGLAAARGPAAFDVVSCLHRKNLGELPEVKKRLIGLGVKKWRILTIFPKGRASANEVFRLPGREFRQLLDFICAAKQEGLIEVDYGCEGFLGAYENEARSGFFFCRAGISIGSVLADGSISACPSLRGDYIQGNIYRESFLAAWQNKFSVMRDRSWTRTGICADCPVYKWCEGNGLHLRSRETNSPALCHYALLGEP